VVKSKANRISFSLEPIEQNVSGSKGIFELVYFMKDSRPLDRFKKNVEEFDRYMAGKTDEEVEKQVGFNLHSFAYSFGELLSIVLLSTVQTYKARSLTPKPLGICQKLNPF
jgi:aspartokinase